MIDTAGPAAGAPTIVAAGNLLVAYDSTGVRVLASSDGGTSWEVRSQLGLVDLAFDPGAADRMAAIDMNGSLVSSRDGGRSWGPCRGVPIELAVLRWSQAGLWAGTIRRGRRKVTTRRSLRPTR